MFSNSPKSMLRAVVEELKKKKKKSLSSYPGQHQMSGKLLSFELQKMEMGCLLKFDSGLM